MTNLTSRVFTYSPMEKSVNCEGAVGNQSGSGFRRQSWLKAVSVGVSRVWV